MVEAWCECRKAESRVMSGSGKETADEKLARRRLEPYLGALEPTDLPGTSGLPDYKLKSPTASGHVEVTSRPDKRRRMQRAAIHKRPTFQVNTPGDWRLHLYPQVDTRELPNARGLETVLNAAKHAGRLLMAGNCHPDVAKVMHSLGIEGATYRATGGSIGTVTVTGGSTGAIGTQGDGVDKWLEAAFQEPGILDHVEKLRRAGGDRRHLFLHVDSTSEAGLGIGLALEASTNPGAAPYRLPTFEPPDDVTDLWVWPDSPGPGLHYARQHGWRMVMDVPWD